MQIIEATSEQVPQLAVLFDLYRQHYGQAPDLAGAEVFLRERIAGKESVIYVSEEEGQLTGFTQLYPVFSSIGMKRAWILNDLFVLPEYRRKGAAKALIAASRQLGEASGARYIMLQTQITNTKARALYESTGFQLDEEFYYYYLSI